MDSEETAIKLVRKDGQPIFTEGCCPLKARANSKLKSTENRMGKSHRWEPTRAERKLISVALAAGLTQHQVADIAGVGLRTLQTRCRGELASGAAQVNAKVANKLFEKCMKGDTVALIFWCKTRLGWREKQLLEHSGPDGTPIQYEAIQAEADAFTARIAFMADRLAAMASDAKEAQPDGDGMTAVPLH